MIDTPHKITLAELSNRLEDPDENLRDLRKYLRIDENLSRPFAPVVVPDPDLVSEPEQEGSFFISLLNRAARRRRDRRYERSRSRPGVKRLVSEGDSWFQYPLLLDDVIDQLSPHYAIKSLGAAADTLASILQRREYMAAIEKERPAGFLLSAGGNDVLGGGRLDRFLRPFQIGRSAEDYLNEAFDIALATAIDQLRTLFDEVLQSFPDLHIFCHGYDYAIPADGRWLGAPMKRAGINNRNLQRGIIRVMVDRFNRDLRTLAETYGGQLHVIDCCGACAEVIQRGGKGWYDELHPSDTDEESDRKLENGGFEIVGERFLRRLEQVLGTGQPAEKTVLRASSERVAETALSPGAEAFIASTNAMPDREWRRTAARAARRILGVEKTGIASDQEIEEFRIGLEKIHLAADFLPADFLTRGADAARAVCRIVTADSLGSGAVIADGQFIITNNHVLPDRSVAASATAQFGFEVGATGAQVALLPDRLFITDVELDFTIVACEPTPDSNIQPLQLLRDPTDIAAEMRVNIIQHPRGRPKEVALHENRVVNVTERVMHYTTDTEPGSSGSPVFDNDWRFVALHHAGINEPGGRARNEGIRIPAIVAKLIATSRGSESFRPEAEQLLPHVKGTSPFLGFFDVAGVVGDPREVEIPSFKGDADFADVGFWNIEQFNGAVAQERVEKVAGVISMMSMDVMGLVEVQRQSVERLVDDMRRRGDPAEFVFHDTTGGLDHAVVFDADTTTVEIDHDIAQRHAARLDARTPAGKTAFPRHPMFVRCRVEDDNVRPLDFMMIVVHLKAFGDAESRARRRLAGQMLAEIIDDIRSDGTPVVLGGDFNESVNNMVLSELIDTPDLFALTSDDEDDNAATFIGGSHRSVIDHIVISDDVRTGDIMGDDAAIIRLDRSIADFAEDISDHVPIIFRMVARDKPLDIKIEPKAGQDTIVKVPDDAKSVNLRFA